MRNRWENVMVNVHYYTDRVNVIEYVQFRVTYNKGTSTKEVTIYTDHSLPWYQVCSCSCNWSLKEGRPCQHAAFCIRFPNLDNKLTREKFFSTFHTGRKLFYSKAHHVDRMIQQYSGTLSFPEWEELVPERVYPWEIPPRSGIIHLFTLLGISRKTALYTICL